MRKNLSIFVAALTLTGALAATAAEAKRTSRKGWVKERVARLHSSELRAIAAEVEMREQFVVEDVRLDSGGTTGDLVLERFRVFRPDARVVVHTRNGERIRRVPRNLYFRGHVKGDPSSMAVLTVRERGGVRGVVRRGQRTFVFGDEADHRPTGVMSVRELGPMELDQSARTFACGTDPLEAQPTLRQMLPMPNPRDRELQNLLGTTHVATIAIESDYEFYQLFGNVTDATDYIADVIGYVSTFYEAEIDTTLELGDVSIWTTITDPWAQSSTSCGLFEFGRYWNDNNDSVERTLTHFMSGKNNGGGVAWIDVLCSGEFNYSHLGSCPSLNPAWDNYGGDYGYSGDLDGNFDVNNPGVLWDVVVVAHELGHNFGSPHSHCYGGIGGNSAAIDSCYTGECGGSGCACGATSLPQNCPGGGQGCGTIMSYCHLLSGGMSNISMTFGQGFAFGDEPERQAEYMTDRVIAANSSYPGCLVPDNSAPTAANDDYDTTEGIAITVVAPGVLDNDTDVDGDPLTATLGTGPSNGTLSLLTSGRFTYTPDNGFSGPDSFTYRAEDGSFESNLATVTIDVAACAEALTLTLTSDVVATTEVYTACHEISAGPDFEVAATGDVTMDAVMVVLNEGFSVADGGRLTVVNP